MYAKGNLRIEVEQAAWNPNVSAAAINRAIRYSTDAGANYITRSNGELLGDNKDKNEEIFPNPKVKLTVRSPDYSNLTWASDARIYDVFVSTNEYDDDVGGQCVQGYSRRLAEQSGGVDFPTNPKVSKEEAMQACAGMGSQKQNCVTDIRMANDVKAISLVVEAFVAVEQTQKQLEKEALNAVLVTSTTASTPPETTLFSNATTTTPAPTGFAAVVFYVNTVVNTVVDFVVKFVREEKIWSIVIVSCATLLILAFLICCCVCVCRCKKCCCFKVILPDHIFSLLVTEMVIFFL